YYLKGWATSMDGAVVYETNYLDSHSYNVEPGAVESNAITVNSTMNLYAVWERAYTNMFGGNDYLFIPDPHGYYAYLYRGGIYFKGDFNDYTGEASFVNSNGKEVLACKISGDYTYCYYDPSRSELVYQLYLGGEDIDDRTTIKFDEYNGITYTEERGTVNQKESRGTYVKDVGNDYQAVFTEGPHAGETMFIRTSSITLENVSDIRVFRIRNDEEKDLGEIKKSFVQSDPDQNYYGGVVFYSSSYYALTLSGYGTAQINAQNGTVNYTYEKDGDKITLTDVSTSVVTVVRLSQMNGENVYVEYNDELDAVFETSDQSESLSLDGLYNATYTDKNGVDHKGYYAVSDSVFGGFIVKVFAPQPDGVLSFLVKKTVETTGGGMIGEDQEDPATVITYELQVKKSGYAEYYLRYADPVSGNVNVYVAPMLVLNDAEEGVADFYGLQSGVNERIFVKIAHGNYSAAEGRLYSVTDIVTDLTGERYGIFDIYGVSSLTYACESQSGYDTYFIVSAIDVEEQPVEGLSERYEKGPDYLILTSAGCFISVVGENVYHGTYTVYDGLVTAVAVIGTSTANLYFELDGTSFTLLDTRPYNAYLLKEDGTDYDLNTYISFDGKGGASYFENGVKQHEGSVERTGASTQFDEESAIYSFTAEGFYFEFISLSYGSVSLYMPYSANYNGRYLSEEAGQLLLDGYGYMAEYINVDGIVYSGRYVIEKENVVRLYCDNDEVLYFDINGRTFTKRGEGYGKYTVTDNQSPTGVFFDFDGYGNASVYSVDENTGDVTYIDENGTYTFDEYGLITVYYETASGSVLQKGRVGLFYYTVAGVRYNEIACLYTDVVMSYVNGTDWSVLTLEDNGQATLYDSKGNVQYGSYVLITDDLLYFEDLFDEENGFIFNYSVLEGSIIPVDNSTKGYYTHDLESLVFSKAGFAIFNNEDRYYYTVDENNAITLYEKDSENPAATKYGFVEIEFGSFGPEMTYKGKTYYANSGYAIKFIRKEVDEDKEADGTFIFKLPVSETQKAELTEINFAPTGATTFSNVTGSVVVGGRNYTCYAFREIDETTGLPVTYVTVSNFRIYITVEYGGVDNAGNSLSSFRVNAVRYMLNVSSIRFIHGFYTTYITQGAFAANEYLANDGYGIISIVTDFDEAGDPGESYIDAEFGKLSGIIGPDGDPVEIERAPYMVYATASGTVYKVPVQMDEYVYNLYFTIVTHSAVRVNGYYVYAFTREEIVKTADEQYIIKAERYLASDNESAVKGSFMSVGMSVKAEDGGETIYNELPLDGGMTYDGETYLIYRVYEQNALLDQNDEPVLDLEGNPVMVNGALLSSKFYKIDFEEDDGVTVGDDSVRPFKSVTVTEIVNTVYVSEDGKSFIEIPESGNLIILVYEGNTYFVENSELDGQTYTITAYGGATFTVTLLDGGVASFEKTEIEP
ncbi:MAG: hypothetical protein J6Z34_01110, partial [Clostridia bacterium]|nr:hypothetical protein [Clostridia bacterium]